MARILAVDDDTAVLALTKAVLELEPGWTVETCDDPLSAVDRLDDLEAPSPDLLLLDVMMPHLSGFELLGWLRHHPHRYDVPVVMLTALSTENDEAEAWHLGCDAYVRKPFRPAELLEVVEMVMSSSPELRIARRRRRLEDLFTDVTASALLEHNAQPGA